MVSKIVKEIKSQTLTLMVAALGFVAALVWKDAISAWLAPLYASGEGAMGLTWAALIVTAVTVVATIALTHALGDKK